jgi:hypothetical protein
MNWSLIDNYDNLMFSWCNVGWHLHSKFVICRDNGVSFYGSHGIFFFIIAI